MATHSFDRTVTTASVTGSVTNIPGDVAYTTAKIGITRLDPIIAWNTGGTTSPTILPGWVATERHLPHKGMAVLYTPLAAPAPRMRWPPARLLNIRRRQLYHRPNAGGGRRNMLQKMR